MVYSPCSVIDMDYHYTAVYKVELKNDEKLVILLDLHIYNLLINSKEIAWITLQPAGKYIIFELSMDVFTTIEIVL